MIGKFHRPKPSNEPNAFEAAKLKSGSAILASNPQLLHKKRGPAQPAQPFEVNYNRVTAYSHAKAGAA